MVDFDEIDINARKQILIGKMEYEEENFISEAEAIKHTIELVLKYNIDKMPFYFMEDLIDYIFTIKRAYDNYKENKFELDCLNKKEEE